MKYSMSHNILCKASQAIVYSIIRDSSSWPELFDPCQSVVVLDKDESYECVEIQAFVNDSLMTWTSRREFLDDIYGINTIVVKPVPLLKSMQVSWRVIPLDSQECIILLTHDYIVADNVVGHIAGVSTASDAANYMKTAIENNSIKELANISDIAQAMAVRRKWSNTHSVICECDVSVAYSVLKNIALWPQIFTACQTANVVSRIDNIEEVAITAKNQEQLLSWITRRTYFDQYYMIDFTLPQPMPLLKSMTGSWRAVFLGINRCIIYVERHFELLDDVSNIIDGVKNLSDAYRFISQFTLKNAAIEMQAFKLFMEANIKL